MPAPCPDPASAPGKGQVDRCSHKGPVSCGCDAPPPTCPCPVRCLGSVSLDQAPGPRSRTPACLQLLPSFPAAAVSHETPTLGPRAAAVAVFQGLKCWVSGLPWHVLGDTCYSLPRPSCRVSADWLRPICVLTPWSPSQGHVSHPGPQTFSCRQRLSAGRGAEALGLSKGSACPGWGGPFVPGLPVLSSPRQKSRPRTRGCSEWSGRPPMGESG